MQLLRLSPTSQPPPPIRTQRAARAALDRAVNAFARLALVIPEPCPDCDGRGYKLEVFIASMYSLKCLCASCEGTRTKPPGD